MLLSKSWAGLHDRLSRGSVRTRRLYAGARTIARLPQVVRRRRAAVRLASPDAPRIAEEDGFLVLDPGRVGPAAIVVDTARALRRATDTAPLWDHSEGRNLLRVALEPRLEREPAWIEFATDPLVLSIVTRYLGAVPLLSTMQLWISPYATHTPDGRPLEHRYHCDWGDHRQVRVLVFVEDVTPDHGPLTVLSAKDSEDLRRARDYTFDEEKSAISDDAAYSLAGPGGARGLVGPSGTVAFADTSRCFHQGSRVRRAGLERLIVMFQYVNVTAFKLSSKPGRRERLAPFMRPGHSELQRLVLGGE